MSTKQEVSNRAAFEAMLRAISHDARGTKAQLDDQFSLAAITPVSGQWYFSTTCPACRERVPIVSDPTEGRRADVFTGPGAMIVRCHVCDVRVTAHAHDLKSVRWP